MASPPLSSCLYRDFLDQHSLLSRELLLDPSTHSRHGAHLTTRTANGTRIALQTAVVSPFFQTGVKRGVVSSLAFESQWNSMMTSRLSMSSERQLELQAHLQASDHVRFTLEARESASVRTPASFARIGCDYKHANVFAGAKIDAVNGPTLEATYGARIGSVAFGVIGAYDVGLDHSDRLGRMTRLDLATSYSQEDLQALLQVNEKGKMVHLNLTQEVNPGLLVGTEFIYDHRKDQKIMRLRSQFGVNDTEVLASSIGSDGILIGAYEWRASAHLKTRISAQMDVRHYDSDSHHLGVSIEIS